MSELLDGTKNTHILAIMVHSVRKHSTRRHRQRKVGGDVQPFPANFYGGISGMVQPAVSAGQDLVKSGGELVRPFLPIMGNTTGGRRKTHRKTRRSSHKSGGFVPSIMEPMSVAASKYIAPVAMFAAYKFMTRKNRKGKGKRTRKN